MKITFRLRSSRVAVALTALLALTACDLYPDAGKWGGDLLVHDDSWNERYTCATDVDITHTNEVVSLNTLDSYCGSRSLHWSLGALNRRGMSLWLSDQRVGEVFPDGTVRIEITDPYSSVHYPNRVQRVVITWTRMGEGLHFTIVEHDFERTRSMEATFHRVN